MSGWALKIDQAMTGDGVGPAKKKGKKEEVGFGKNKGEKRKSEDGTSSTGGGGAAAAKPKKKAGGGGGRPSNPPRYRDIASQVLQNTRDLSYVMSIVFHTLLVPATSQFVIRAQTMGQIYYEQTKNNKKHKLGSPHLHIWNQWIIAAQEHMSADDQDSYDIESFMTEYGAEQSDVGKIVKLARCTKTYDEGIFRIQFNSNDLSKEVTRTLIKLMKEDGAEEKHTVAPKGPRERRIEEFLRGLTIEDEES
jgi:hypothetical protein